MNKIDQYIAIFLIGFSAFLFKQTFKWTSFSVLLPRLILIAIIILNIILLITKKIRKKAIENKINDKKENKDFSLYRIFFTILATITYINIIKYLGFYFSSYLFITIMLIFFGVKKKITNLIFPLIIVLVLFFIFSYFLKIPTPKGLII